MEHSDNIFTQITASPAHAGAGTPPTAPPPGAEAPPPYSTLPAAPSDVTALAWSNPGAVGMGGYNPRGYKLGYMDFVPRIVKKKTFGPTVYEDHSTLVQRANNWLEEHAGITVVACETVTWLSHDPKEFKNVYADTCYCVGGKCRMRGLRLWYMTSVVPSPQQSRSVQVISCRTFVPGPEERFNQLINRINDQLKSEKLGGNILCVETLPVFIPTTDYRPAVVNPDRSTYILSTDTYTKVLCVRLYAMFVGSEVTQEALGYQDFVPEFTQRHKENRGYEVYSELMDRASRWVARQQGVRFTNVHSVTVKIKKKMAFEERCVFKVHSSAQFLSLVRAFFVIPQGLPGTGQRPEFPACRLTYRTFTPGQVSMATFASPVQYEDTRTLCDRVNQWLQITGAQVFAVETVPIRINVGFLGPESTFCKHQDVEKVLYHIRLYLHGEYMEPPGAISLVSPGNMRITAHSEPNLSF